MKLYDVPENTKIRLCDHTGNKLELLFHRLNGMYSHCTDSQDNVVHLAAWVDVEVDNSV